MTPSFVVTEDWTSGFQGQIRLDSHQATAITPWRLEFDWAANITSIWDATIESRVGQHYTMVRNGVVINEFDNTPGKQSSRAGDPPTDQRQFSTGYIGLQNHSMNDKIAFRKVRVKLL